MIDRLSAPFAPWWETRTERERRLLMGLGVLTALLVLWYGVLAPLNALAGAAEARRLAAERDLAEARALAPVAPAATTGSPERVRAQAMAAGVEIMREDPAGEDGYEVWTAPVPAPAAFAWLAALGREGLGVRSVEMHRAEAERVEVRVAFATRTP